jgi:hypothetical protein
MKQLAIIGFAREHCSIAGKVHMYSNVVGNFETEIWMRHSKVPKTKKASTTKRFCALI